MRRLCPLRSLLLSRTWSRDLKNLWEKRLQQISVCDIICFFSNVSIVFNRFVSISLQTFQSPKIGNKSGKDCSNRFVCYLHEVFYWVFLFSWKFLSFQNSLMCQFYDNECLFFLERHRLISLYLSFKAVWYFLNL